MANCHYANFDIAIHGQASPYGVRATYAQYAAEEEVALDASDTYWNACLEQLADIGRLPGRSRLEEIGATLFAALLHDDIRDLWLRARTETETGVTGGLRMRLSLPPELGVLPWEGLFDPDRNTMLAVNRRTPVVRVDNLYRYVGAVRSIDTTLPLRLLVVVPDDPSGLIDASGERKRIHQALNPLEPDGVHVRHLAGQVTVLDLRQEVEHFEPDIIHLISHGQSNGLLLWQDGHPALVSGGVLRMIFESASSIRLVLLNACATAQSSQDEPFSSLGGQLLQAGIPAVVAMQYDVDDVAAARFAEFFYSELVAGTCPGAVDVAMSYARSNLYALAPDQFAYGIPVLWLNGNDAHIFHADRPVRRRSIDTQHQAASVTPAELEKLRQRYAAESAWLAAYRAPDIQQLPADLRSLAGQLPQFVQENQDILARMLGLQAQEVSIDHQRQWVTWLERVKSNRAAAERILAMIHAFRESKSD